MNKLFWYMVKEEWRIHSTMFGSLSFAMFPIMICGIAFMGSFLLPLMRNALPQGNLSLIIHSNYLLLGFMVGAFGLLGNEAMNRRFGQASLLAYSARNLPLSDRYIFTIFVLKDTCYYFILWVFPFVLGYLVASPCIGVPLASPFLLTLTLTISFLFGLSIVFFLSMIYTRSKRVLTGILVVLVLIISLIILLLGTNPVLLFPPVMLFQKFSWITLISSVGTILILFSFSIILYTPENSSTSKRYQNALHPLALRLSPFPYPILAAKDIIDLYRSGGAIGQTLFSFIIPLTIIWFFLSLTNGYLPQRNILFLFSITTGVIASTMYTWLTAFDSFSAYACLPLSIRTIITSKISSFLLLQIIPIVYVSLISLVSGQSEFLIPAIVLCLSISCFALAVTIWLCGLSPQVMVYDVTVMIRYFIVIGIVTTVCSSLAFTNPWLSLFSVLLIIPAWVLIHKGFIKWEDLEQPMY
ncbi:MAG TPA: hypothetical protein VN372_07225 [Methanospirillum sp.]|nr:hypothetical protein [Methanospirillum sp.]